MALLSVFSKWYVTVLVDIAPTTGVKFGSVGASIPARTAVEFLAIVLPTNSKFNIVYWYCVLGVSQAPLERSTKEVRLPATLSYIGPLLVLTKNITEGLGVAGRSPD